MANNTTVTFYRYNYDNRTNLNEMDLNEYSITDLEDYFKYDFTQEKKVFSKEIFPMVDRYLINLVDRKFKIQCLRKTRYNYYTVYKVKEGGKYFVFWSQGDDGTVYVERTFYIKGLNANGDFRKIKEKRSSYKDVLNVDTNTDLDLRSSLGRFSYSVLADGRLLKISYVLEQKTIQIQISIPRRI